MVRRGDPITERVDVVRKVDLAPNSANLDGVIVASMAEDISIMGNGNVLYIDKGEADGVRQGNT
ncbi:MAG TPA: hypothetical protein VLB84_10105, partial [Bacteroidia bacterium]|nr:hypothetical protein [Bacteroidia bacterium]